MKSILSPVGNPAACTPSGLGASNVDTSRPVTVALSADSSRKRPFMSTAAARPTLAGARRLDSRVVIVGALIATICAIFWLGSRYPSLQSKAGADPDEALSTPLG